MRFLFFFFFLSQEMTQIAIEKNLWKWLVRFLLDKNEQNLWELAWESEPQPLIDVLTQSTVLFYYPPEGLAVCLRCLLLGNKNDTLISILGSLSSQDRKSTRL